MSLLNINTPFPTTSQLQLVVRYLEPYSWPSGRYYSDASGGEHNSYPLLRRCGFGIVRMREGLDDKELQCVNAPEDAVTFGAFGVLPGEKQTVPRAELYAILEIIINLLPNAAVEICSDSKVNIDLYQAGEEQAVKSANSDLWTHMFELICVKSLNVQLRCVKGHATVENSLRYNVSATDAFGNFAADELANRAANHHAVFYEDVFAVKWHTELVMRIQKRAIVILSLAGVRNAGKQATLMRKERPMTLTAQAMLSQHTFTAFGKKLHCQKCHKVSPLGVEAARAWLRTPCQPDKLLTITYSAGTVRPSRIPLGKQVVIGNATVHTSHELMVFRGLQFCKKCGSYAVKKLENLARTCDPAGDSPEDAMRKKNAVKAILQGKLPRGLKQYPNSATKLQQLQLKLLEDGTAEDTLTG